MNEYLFDLINISVYRYNLHIVRNTIMDINEILKKKKMSKYALSKQSNVPYATLSDICSDKTELKKCSGETIFKIAKALNVSMEDLLENCMEERISFELFKSNVCHELKRLGDIDFLISKLQSNEIEEYWNKRWYPECLYLVAMVDYISRINDVPLCNKYDEYRNKKIKSIIYPSSILIRYYLSNDEEYLNNAYINAIPEFKRFNIVENEVRNVA